MQLKIIAISMAKNEIDIIEAFVRHTLSFVSHLVILDDDSTDGTLEILKALKQEGLNLTVIENKEPGLSQFLIMNRLMSDQAIKTHNADWVLPLDADEFVSTIDGKSLINDDVPTNQVLSLQWRNYLPHTTDKKGVLNPILRIKIERRRIIKKLLAQY